MKPRVAVIEDDELIYRMVGINLEKAGFKVNCFDSAEQFKKSIGHTIHDLIILDISLKQMSGLHLLQELRKRGINVPILMLTVDHRVQTKIDALNAGADDYLVKPFNMNELIARVKRLIQRSTGERVIPSNRILLINQYKIFLETHECESSQGKLILSDREIKLLTYFSRHAGETLRREDILEEVWGMNVDPTPRTIDNFIAKFRKLFEKNPEQPRHFITVWNQGYRFDP